MIEINNYFKTWSEKLSIPIENITKDFENEKSKLPAKLSDDEKSDKALKILALNYKKFLRSPAVGFEGMIIAVGDVVDVVAKKRKEAITFFETNPQKAIEMGITNSDGVPLETRKEWAEGRPNYNFGKPIPENSYLRNIWGIALKSNITNDKPKFFSISISGERALDDNVPIFVPVKFRAIDKTPGELLDKKYVLSSSQITNFEIDDSINLPVVKDLLKNMCSDMVVEIKNLQNYHNANKEVMNRLAIIEGDVSTLVLEPSSVGSRRIILEDGDNLDIESKGVTCWIPQRMPIDFAEQSKVIVIGRTGTNMEKDVDGNKTEVVKDMTMNVYGLYAIPEFKVKLPEPIEFDKENPTEPGW